MVAGAKNVTGGERSSEFTRILKLVQQDLERLEVGC